MTDNITAAGLQLLVTQARDQLADPDTEMQVRIWAARKIAIHTLDLVAEHLEVADSGQLTPAQQAKFSDAVDPLDDIPDARIHESWRMSADHPCPACLAERDATIKAALALHRPSSWDPDVCACTWNWPCPTAEALSGVKPQSKVQP